MVTLPDLIYVALFAVAMPLWDYLVSWPAFHRKLQADPARARKRLWTGNIGYLWALVAVGAALWVANDRPWRSLGFSVPEGWRLWVAVGLVLLLVVYNVQAAAAVARDSETRASVRRQIGKLAEVVSPHTRTELYLFGGVSLPRGSARNSCSGGTSSGHWLHGSAGGARRRCQCRSSRARTLTRDGMAPSARGSSARSTHWSWRFSARSGQRSCSTYSSISARESSRGSRCARGRPRMPTDTRMTRSRLARGARPDRR
jgi:hypothetical protein